MDEAETVIDVIGGDFETAEAGSIKVGSPHLLKSEIGAALEMASCGRLEVEGPSRWPHALIVAFESSTGRLTISRGGYCSTPAWYASAEFGFILAPSRLVFGQLPHFDGIASLKRGWSLRHDGESRTVQLWDGWRDWARDGVEFHDYEADKIRLRELVTESARALLQSQPPAKALALSGGVDSAVLARVAIDLGHPPLAFNVSFMLEDGSIPEDLSRARLTAGMLGLKLREIIVRPDEVKSLIRETIRRGGNDQAFSIEGHLYLTRLCQELTKEGLKSCLLGAGADALLGSKVYLDGPGSQGEFQKKYLNSLRSIYGLESPVLISQSFGIRFLRPFVHPQIEKFCFSLPPEYLVKEQARGFLSKRILRGAFASGLPEEVVSGGKSHPPESTGSTRQLASVIGGKNRRRKYYQSEFRQQVYDATSPSWVQDLWRTLRGGR